MIVHILVGTFARIRLERSPCALDSSIDQADNELERGPVVTSALDREWHARTAVDSMDRVSIVT